ncbi:hypothetical protein ACOMHN_026850 [Nucella lapillus]
MKHKTWGDLVQPSCGGSDYTSDQETAAENGQHTEGMGETTRKHTTAQQLRRVKKNNIIHARLLVAASFVCGVVVSQRGPSILDLGDVTHASLISTTSLFSLGALGQTIGCVVAGLLLGRLHSSVFLFWMLLAMCGSTAVLPWCRQYGALALLYCVSLLCVGCVETGSYADVAKRWGRQGSNKIQLLQLWFVVGAVISPGFTQFFLTPRLRHHHHTSLDNVTSGQQDSANITSTWKSDVIDTLEPTPFSLSRNESHTSSETDSQAHMAYGVSGALAFFVSMPFLVSFMLRKELPQSPARKRDTPKTPSHLQVRGVVNMIVLLLVAFFIFAISAVEESMHQFLFTFLIQKAGWSAHAAGWITTWFWSGVLLVRLVVYFIPGQIPDEAILALSCAMLPCNLAALHFSVAFSNNNAVWASVFFIGMSVSLVFPVSFTWIHTSLAQRSSLVSAVVMVSSLAAGIANPLVLGYFLHSGQHSGFTLLLLLEAVLGLLVFLVLYVLSRKLSAAWLDMATRKSILVPGRLEEVGDEEDAQELESR